MTAVAVRDLERIVCRPGSVWLNDHRGTAELFVFLTGKGAFCRWSNGASHTGTVATGPW